MNPEDVGPLVRAGRKRLLFEPTTLQALRLGRDKIERLLHHREPFLLLDEVTAVDTLELAATGARRIDPADPILRGHFPHQAIYPGVLLLEIIGQLGLCLLALLEKMAEHRMRWGAHPVKFAFLKFITPFSWRRSDPGTNLLSWSRS